MIVEATVIIGSFLFGFYLGYFLLMWTRSKGWKALRASKNLALSVSLVVPTYNEEDVIVRKLKNLMEQDCSTMEIIAVDSASEDRTVELIENFVRNSGLSVKLIKEDERKGKASALNRALKHCSGEIVVITDADAIWKKDALRQVLSNFSDPNVGAVTGRQILLNPNQSLATKVEKAYRNIYEVLRIGESAVDSTPIFHGEMSCYRRKLIEDVSEDSMADDSEMAVKIRKKGFRILYDPNAVFYEYAPPTFKSRLTQKLRRGQGLIQLFWRERAMMLDRRHGNFGMVVLPAEFFMHVVSPILVLAFSFLFSYNLFLIANYLPISLSAAILVAILLSFVALTIKKVSIANLPLSFWNSQLILFLSLICHMLGRSQHKWRKVVAVRELWRKESVSV